MALKQRAESKEIKILRILNYRGELTTDEKQYYHYLVKGYQGELMFDELTEKLQCESLILNDLLLRVNNSDFQIDTLLILQETIYLFDVKNSDGDFIYDSGNIRSVNGTNDRKNPLHQLERCVSLLRQLLKKLGFHYPVEPHLIFINPEFSLYQASTDLPIILPTQLNRLMQKLDKTPSKLNNRHHTLANQLIAAHQTESSFTQLPKYEYEQLVKGTMCATCHSFSLSVVDRWLVCNECGCEERIESAILRGVGELQLLFPERKITTNGVFEWCGGIISARRIRRILSKNFKRRGQGKFSYFV